MTLTHGGSSYLNTRFSALAAKGAKVLFYVSMYVSI